MNVLHLWFVSHFSCFTAALWLVSVLQTFQYLQCKIQAIVAIYLQPKQMVWDFFPLSLTEASHLTANQWINISVCELLWPKTSDLSKSSTLREANLVFLCYVYLREIFFFFFRLMASWLFRASWVSFNLKEINVFCCFLLRTISLKELKHWKSPFCCQ